MKRVLALLVFTLAVCSLPASALGQAEGPTVTKAPKLVKFVPAVYPPDKHDAGITASVELSIEIGADGQVGEVSVVKNAPTPDFDAAAVAAVKQFVFEPAEIDGEPAPVKITYRYEFTIVEKMVKAGPQINFDGVVLERLKKRPLARVSVKIKELDGVTAQTDEDGHFAFMDVPPGKYKVEISHPKLMTVQTEETIAAGKRRTVKYLVEEKEECARRASRRRRSRPGSAQKKRAASPAPRATR
jgi:TonB family protein